MTKPNHTVSAVTTSDLHTVSAMPVTITPAASPAPALVDQQAIAPAVADPQAPRHAVDLTLQQRQVLLVRCAEMVSAKHPVVLPWGIDLRAFLTLFDRDLSKDFSSSNLLRTRTDLNRREVSRLIAIASKIEL